MLTLTRGVGESVLIGDDIEVLVTSMQPGRVRLGFTAPCEVKIIRKEIYRQDENPSAGDKKWK